MTDLFTATAPTESGYFWWRLDRNAMPLPAVIDLGASTFYVLCGDRWQDHIYGLWGPRIPLPIAPPVECWAVEHNGAIMWTATERTNADHLLASAQVGLKGSDVPPRLVSGVFYPTAVVETNDADD